MGSRNTLALVTGVLFCFVVVACGDARRGTPTATSLSSSSAAPVMGGLTPEKGTYNTTIDGHLTGDDDVDDEYTRHGTVSADDFPITEYGHAASATDRRTVTALVKRYYAEAVAEDGAKACGLVRASLLKDPGLKKTVPEDRFSRPVHPHASPGETCTQVTSKLFKQDHQTLPSEARTLQVLGVRADGIHGVAVLGFKRAPERWLPVVREDGVWKIQALLASEMP